MIDRAVDRAATIVSDPAVELKSVSLCRWHPCSPDRPDNRPSVAIVVDPVRALSVDLAVVAGTQCSPDRPDSQPSHHHRCQFRLHTAVERLRFRHRRSSSHPRPDSPPYHPQRCRFRLRHTPLHRRLASGGAFTSATLPAACGHGPSPTRISLDCKGLTKRRNVPSHFAAARRSWTPSWRRQARREERGPVALRPRF